LDDQGLSLIELMHRQQVQFHGVQLHRPDWGPDSRSLAFTAFTPGGKLMLYMAINAYFDPLEFEIPERTGTQAPWKRWIDTFLAAPDDICSWNEAPFVQARSYLLQPRSVVALLAKSSDESE
jgi:glycogen operon protein